MSDTVLGECEDCGRQHGDYHKSNCKYHSQKSEGRGMTPGHETPVVTAKREIAEEEYREAVEREKARIRAYRPWYHRIFPFTITITRRK